MVKRVRNGLGVLMLAMVVTAGAAIAQETRPAEPPKFDQAQCLRETERVGRELFERLAKAVRESQAVKELEAASDKLKAMLRDACAAGSVLASEEARIAARKMVDAAITALHSMRAALEGFYASLSDEQKRKLDGFLRQLRPEEPKP
jgi:hypothetical protein